MSHSRPSRSRLRVAAASVAVGAPLLVGAVGCAGAGPDAARVDAPPPAAASAPDVRTGDRALAEAVARALADLFPYAAVERDVLYGWEVESRLDDHWEFDVAVDDGIVSLDGTVGSREDLRDVVSTVRGVPGVQEVTADLWPVRELEAWRPYDLEEDHPAPDGYPWTWPDRGEPLEEIEQAP